jgi:hypothetical protein
MTVLHKVIIVVSIYDYLQEIYCFANNRCNDKTRASRPSFQMASEHKHNLIELLPHP